MNADYCLVAPGFYVAPQIQPEDVADMAAMGVTLIINNRPDGEEPMQPMAADIAAAAAAAGVSFVSIPVRGGMISETELDAFDAALAANSGAVLAYCLSGTRSTLLRACAAARSGVEVSEILEEAANAGYNFSQFAPRFEALAANRA